MRRDAESPPAAGVTWHESLTRVILCHYYAKTFARGWTGDVRPQTFQSIPNAREGQQAFNQATPDLTVLYAAKRECYASGNSHLCISWLAHQHNKGLRSRLPHELLVFTFPLQMTWTLCTKTIWAPFMHWCFFHVMRSWRSLANISCKYLLQVRVPHQ